MRPSLSAVVCVLPLWMLATCGNAPGDKAGGDSGPAAEGARGDCNPVDGGHCLFPFPSSFFLADDDTAPSGVRVDFGQGSLPTNIDGVQMDPAEWNRKDGFPIMGGMFALLPGVVVDNAAVVDDIGLSMEDSSPTVILDAETGERVPHWVELERFTDDPDRRALILRPVAPMDFGRRYVVGIRGMVDGTGSPVAAPAGFAALRDGTATDGDLTRQQGHYDDVVFPALESAGIARDELQLAWDFVTTSQEGSLGPILHMRDDALATVGDSATYRVTSQQEGNCAGGARIGRTVELELDVPLYLTTWAPGAEARLVHGGDGMPESSGLVGIPMVVQVPCAVLDAGQPAPLLQFGHGLFGNRGHSQSSSMQAVAAQAGAVLYAVDWTGMKDRDAAFAALIMSNDPTDFVSMTDRLHQGHVEGWVATRAMQTVLVSEPLLRTDADTPLIDPTTVTYFGTSLGSILGGAHVAMSTEISRAVLNVPGAPFSMLLPRSSPFEPFFSILNTKYSDPADISAILALTQMMWDPTETGGLMHFLSDNPVDDKVASSRDLLLVTAIGDLSVNSRGGHIIARAAGATNMEPLNRDVWGVPSAAPPFSGSALLEMDFGYEEPGPTNPETVDVEGGPHNMPFGSPQAQALSAHFLVTGEVISVCDGPCDPD